MNPQYNNMKEEVETFLKEKLTGNWPFINLVELTNKLGENAKDHLNNMAKQGYVKKRAGVNTPLIEITELGIQYLRKNDC